MAGAIGVFPIGTPKQYERERFETLDRLPDGESRIIYPDGRIRAILNDGSVFPGGENPDATHQRTRCCVSGNIVTYQNDAGILFDYIFAARVPAR